MKFALWSSGDIFSARSVSLWMT